MEDAITLLQQEMDEKVKLQCKIIARHRDKFIKAFIARYGCGPENLIMVEETTYQLDGFKTRIYFEKFR